MARRAPKSVLTFDISSRYYGRAGQSANNAHAGNWTAWRRRDISFRSARSSPADCAGEGMTPEQCGRSESFWLTAINASIWSVKALESPD
jgi:hypothetical protein